MDTIKERIDNFQNNYSHINTYQIPIDHSIENDDHIK